MGGTGYEDNPRPPRAKELADLRATDHFGAYLDFYCPRPPGAVKRP
jgi:hypothetical protein